MALVFIIVFMFVFSKGIEVLTNTNSYKIPYEGPDKSAFETVESGNCGVGTTVVSISSGSLPNAISILENPWKRATPIDNSAISF